MPGVEEAMDNPSLNLSGLSIAYRRLVLWFGAQLFVIIVSGLLPASTTTSPSRPIGPFSVVSTTTHGGVGYVVLSYVLWIFSLIILAALTIYAYRTAAALGSSQPSGWAIAMLLPGVNFLTLIALSAKAGKACREHGLPVGLFGPGPQQRE
jgi:hypothetical protein